MRDSQRPLLVFGPRSATYDFGPSHPLTPRRFGPGIDLLRAVGAVPGLAPEPATDAELLTVHDEAYLRVVKAFSDAPLQSGEAGIGPGDVPPFAGMHQAAAAVAGGSLAAMDCLLRGDALHAFHPGGGLHHAMPGRASGFCVYNDPALAIALARSAGLRVLYLDFDVHHGDGVEAIHRHDPGVLTFSIHESGRTLFPGTGGIGETDDGVGSGTAVNLPLEAGTGAEPWLAAIERTVPELAAAFGPDVLVTQHGSDAHAWDPLAHLAVTTTAMGAAARLTDRLAHRHAAGRWLATGGGGYDVYRVVPRAWALVWLAAAHEAVPDHVPATWRARWATEAARYGQAPLPERFEDAPGVGGTEDASMTGARTAAESVDLVRILAVPALISHAVDAGWWSPERMDTQPRPAAIEAAATGRPAILPDVDALTWGRLRLLPGVAGPADPTAGHELVGAALAAGADRPIVSVAVAGDAVVALAASAEDRAAEVRRLLAIGVAPAWRGAGVARAVLAAHLGAATGRAGGGRMEMLVTAAERDVRTPLPRLARVEAARRLLGGAGFELTRPAGLPGRADPRALVARLSIG